MDYPWTIHGLSTCKPYINQPLVLHPRHHPPLTRRRRCSPGQETWPIFGPSSAMVDIFVLLKPQDDDFLVTSSKLYWWLYNIIYIYVYRCVIGHPKASHGGNDQTQGGCSTLIAWYPPGFTNIFFSQRQLSPVAWCYTLQRTRPWTNMAMEFHHKFKKSKSSNSICNGS